MKKPDFEKCAQEVDEMESLPLASVEVSVLGIFAAITLIQAAVQQEPNIADDEWAKIGIATAQQLQKELFNQHSEAYKVLEFGWNPELYITPSDRGRGCNETTFQQISHNVLESPSFQLDM